MQHNAVALFMCTLKMKILQVQSLLLLLLFVTYLALVDPALLITECKVTLIVVYLHEQSTYFTCIVVTNTVIQ